MKSSLALALTVLSIMSMACSRNELAGPEEKVAVPTRTDPAPTDPAPAAPAPAAPKQVASAFPAGIYELTAQITTFDPAWGDLTGYRYSATLTIPVDRIGGSWENFHLIDAAGQPSEWVRAGTIESYKDFAGRNISELVSSNFHLVLVDPVQDPTDPLLITGGWGCCGHIAGTFTARRRQ